MRQRTRVPGSLQQLADAQGGLVTTAQALAAGLTSRAVEGLLDRGTWTTLAHGVHATRHSDRGWMDLAWAGLLIGGEEAALGGAAAAHLYGIAPAPKAIDIWIPGGSRVPHPLRANLDEEPTWRFRRGTRRALGTPPRITVEEAVLDLCSGASADDQAGWLSVAIREQRTSPARLLHALERHPRVTGRRRVAELIEVVGGGSQSPLEVRYFRDVVRPHGLPYGQRQRSASTGTRSDVVYQQYSTIVELDGELGHRGRGESHDAWRDAHHLILGLVTLRFGWADLVDRACEVARIVAAVLQRQGWSGVVKPCLNCP